MMVSDRQVNRQVNSSGNAVEWHCLDQQRATAGGGRGSGRAEHEFDVRNGEIPPVQVGVRCSSVRHYTGTDDHRHQEDEDGMQS